MDSKDKKYVHIRVDKLIIAGIALLIVLVCAVVCLVYGDKETEEIKTHGVVITGNDANKAISTITDAMNDIRSKNILISVTDTTSAINMIYNDKREAIGEALDSGYKMFYLPNHRTVQFSGVVAYGYDSDVLSMMEIALDLQKSEKLPVLKYDWTKPEDENNQRVTDYMIDIRGWDNIKKLYSYIDGEFADLMVENLKKSLENTNKANESLNIRIVYTIDGNEITGGSCYVYYGDKDSKDITAEDLEMNWYFEGSLDLKEWRLDTDWYNIVWEDIDESNVSEVTELFKKQYNSILEMLKEFASENGVDGVLDKFNNV